MKKDTYCNDDYFDEHPTHIIVDFTKEFVERILGLNKALIDSGADSICIYDSTPTYFEDEGEWDGSTETEKLNIHKHGIHWDSYVKNSSVQIFTDTISMEEIKEMGKVFSTPLKDLPLLVNDLKSAEAQKLFGNRLKND